MPRPQDNPAWAAVFENPVRPGLVERRAAREEYHRVVDPAWSDYQAKKIPYAEYRRIESAARKMLQRKFKELGFG